MANRAVSALIGELRVWCPYKALGCDATVTVDTLGSHIPWCVFAPRSCEFNYLGCPFIGSKTQKHGILFFFCCDRNANLECPFVFMKSFVEDTKRKIASLEITVRKQQDIIDAWMRSSSENEASMPTQSGLAFQETLDCSPTWPDGHVHCRATVSGIDSGITSLAYDGKYLFAGNFHGAIRMYTFSQTQPWKITCMDDVTLTSTYDHAHKWCIWALKYHPLSQYLFSGGIDENIHVWSVNHDQAALERVACLKGHAGKIYDLSSSQTLLFSSSSDKTIKVILFLFSITTPTC